MDNRIQIAHCGAPDDSGGGLGSDVAVSGGVSEEACYQQFLGQWVAYTIKFLCGR